MATGNRTPVDVWLKFDACQDAGEHLTGQDHRWQECPAMHGNEEPSHEGNTFPTEDGRFLLEWYHTAVGQVSHKEVDTYADAVRFWESNGFRDFSS